MDLYVPSSPRASRKLVAIAFPTFRHYIPFLLLLLLLLLLHLILSKGPSALLKLSKGVVFTPIASTNARGVHRHQAILILSLYHSKRIHCLLPKAALNDAILFSSHTPLRARAVVDTRGRFGKYNAESEAESGADPTETVMCLLSYILGDYEQSLIGENRKHWYLLV